MSFTTLPLAAMLMLAPVGQSGTQGQAEWPQWRGPNQDAICKETGLLKQWPADGPPKVWTVGNLGTGHSTPSIAAGQIFGMGTRGGKDGVWALNEADGKELWFTPIDSPKNVNQNNGPGCTPTYDKGMVFAISNNGKLVGLEAKTGKTVWQVDFVKDFGAKPSADKWWGYNGSVLVDGDKVVCATGSATNAVIALDPKTGKVIWKTPVPKSGTGFGYSTPVKATIAGVPMYITLLGGDEAHQVGGLVGSHATTGKLLWQYEKVGNPIAAIPSPIVKGDLIWCSSSYTAGGSALIQLIPAGNDMFTVKELKYYAKKSGGINNHHGGMVLVGDYVFFGHDQNQGSPVCVEFKTGAIKWGPEKAPAGGLGSSAYLYADGLFYVRFQNHVMTLLKLDPEAGVKVISSFKPADASKQPAWAHPVIVNGRMYIHDQDKLTCYNLKSASN